METTWQDIGRYLEEQLRAKGRDAIMTYGELLLRFPDLPDFTGAWSAHPLCDMFGELDIEDASFGRPFRTAAVVSQDDRVPGGGFFKMYVKYRDKKAKVRTDMDKIEAHQKELKELAKHYGH